ncbi:hypothetical protein [Chitinophaga ginsengisoli]|uniref:Uncharacterized protein n=1 Tax=Chitinophaga ginsengisoli TaxID=363837 RepID=A0A2P8FX66_9BACT|nr:hypothetical protein [Chitinophaga ginsengisoli]PSL26313.1 hypothetical protein CLV42_11124 [Chitinophaga ginsengisoli]
MMSRKMVTVPKDKYAEDALDYDDAMPEHLIEVEFTVSEFRELWDVGFFDALNDVTLAMIDDFESAEIIKREHLEEILNSDVFNLPVSNDILDRLKRLFEEALERGTGVYFSF